LAVQYAKAMGLRVAAVDIADDKLELARKLGASLTFNAKAVDAVKAVQEAIGGAHGVLITAVSKAASPRALKCSAAAGRAAHRPTARRVPTLDI
jgi:alcohol dehydrogenase, propanol-preferring